MRFNSKELTALAGQPSYKFEKEGVLLIKERQEGIFRRNDVYVERFCRLRGNLLFYQKSRDSCSEAVGVYVLENCSVQLGPKQNGLFYFSIVYTGEDHIYMACHAESERDAWIKGIGNASFECIRQRIIFLRSKLASKQRESDPGLYASLVSPTSLYQQTTIFSSLNRPHKPGAHGANGVAAPLAPSSAIDGNNCSTTDTVTYLELSISCDNLRCDADGRCPSSMCILNVSQPPQSTAWTKYAQTEVVDRCSNPTFLTSVSLRTDQHATARVKLCIYDVREKISCTRTLLGEAIFAVSTLLQANNRTLRLTLLSPQYVTVGFVSVVCSEETLDASNYQQHSHIPSNTDRPRSASLPLPSPLLQHLPISPCLVQSQLRTVFDNIELKKYRFKTGLGAELRVHELMAETKLSFSFPQLLLNLWINEEKRLMETVVGLGELSANEWRNRQLTAIERHMHLVNTYTQALDAIAEHRGSFFKPSTLKGDRFLEFVPVNLHLQRLWVQNTTSKKVMIRESSPAVATFSQCIGITITCRAPPPNASLYPTIVYLHDVITVGAFTAYSQRYHQGGLERQINQLKSSYPNLTSSKVEGGSCAHQWLLGPDRLSMTSQAMVVVSELREQLEADIQALLRAAHLQEPNSLIGAMSRINTRSKQLTTVCHPALVDEALTIWENAKCAADNQYRSAAFQNGRQQQQQSLQQQRICDLVDLGGTQLQPSHRLKSASLPRQFGTPNQLGLITSDPMEDFPSPSTESSSSSGEDMSPVDNRSLAGSVKSVDVRTLSRLSRSNRGSSATSCYRTSNTCSTTVAGYGGGAGGTLATCLGMLAEEFEPLDLTHLNIRASIMCMSSKVNSLSTNGAAPASNTASDDNNSTSPGSDMSPWASELMPSIKKLRQATTCLERVARLTYGLLSLKEPSHNASLSHCVRYRRDICFSHALTAVVSALMARLWCQPTPDDRFMHCIRCVGSVLAQFTGLLSCYSDEQGMLEDMLVAVKDLRRVTFTLEPVGPQLKSPRPRVEGNRVFVRVILPVPRSLLNDDDETKMAPLCGEEESLFAGLSGERAGGRANKPSPPSATATGRGGGRKPNHPFSSGAAAAFHASGVTTGTNNANNKPLLRFTITPALLNVGINEQATLAERFGDTSFQDKINTEGVNVMRDYWRRVQKYPWTNDKAPEGSRDRLINQSASATDVGQLIEQMQKLVRAKKSKNVDLLHAAQEACRRMRGLRFTSCKSAKDRTSMSVTLEQGQVLIEEFGFDQKELPRAVDCMRSEGTRRENCNKNVGVKKYAFNSLQLMSLPKAYRPPAGTFGNVMS